MFVFVILGRAIYAGSVAYCPLASHVEYAPARPIKVGKKMEQTDGRQTDLFITLTVLLGAVSVIAQTVTGGFSPNLGKPVDCEPEKS